MTKTKLTTTICLDTRVRKWLDREVKTQKKTNPRASRSSIVNDIFLDIISTKKEETFTSVRKPATKNKTKTRAKKKATTKPTRKNKQTKNKPKK